MLRHLLSSRCVLACVLAAAPLATPNSAASGRPLFFLPCAEAPGRWVAQAGGLTAWADGEGLTLQLVPSGAEGGAAGAPATGAVLRVTFPGAAPGARLVPEQGAGPRVRAYRGRGGPAAREASGALRYEGLWPGVDLRLLVRDGRLAYDLLLAPGAELSPVTLEWEGALGLERPAPGRLVVHTAAGPLEQPLPAAWQVDPEGGSRPVAARFELRGVDQVGFAVEARDPCLPTVIDPVLQYGTYLGGQFLDRVLATGLAADGDVLLAGVTFSPDFPATTGAFQGALQGDTDAFVARLDGASGALQWATFLGGDDGDPFSPEQATDLEVLPGGAVLVTGDANSGDFPTTPGASQPARPGAVDAFVARLGADGALAWSTYLGAGANDQGRALAADAAGRPIVVGTTFSSDFPVTPGAYDQTFNSIFFSNDVFVARLAADGSAIQWATYLGGSLRDDSFGVDLDAQQGVVLAGLTGSIDFPATVGAYDPAYNGAGASNTDAWVARLAPDGSALSWASFYGGAGIVEGRALAVSPGGAVLLGGLTRSADLPGTALGWQPGYGGGASDGFVAAFSGDGTTLHWASYVGGALEDRVLGLQPTSGGQCTLTGDTTSPDFPTSATWVGAGDAPSSLRPGSVAAGAAPIPTGAPASTGGASLGSGLDDSLGGASDAFLVRLGVDGRRLLFSTLVGGSDADGGRDLALDALGAVVLVGESASPDLPISADAADPTFNGVTDGFVVRLAVPPLLDLGGAVLGSAGRPPRLVLEGAPEAGLRVRVGLTDGRPGAPALLVMGVAPNGLPPRAEERLAWPVLTTLLGRVDGDGALTWWNGAWPVDVPSRFTLQAWVLDPVAPAGLAASDVLLVVP